MSDYLARTLETVVAQTARQFPAVVVTGPRQAGKTTLLRHVLGSSVPLVSLDDPDVRQAAMSDPRGFLAAYPPPVVLDEVQRAPELLPYVKNAIDENRSEPGRYFLSGSQNLLLMEQITESLAGRAAILTLMPLSQREIDRQPAATFPWESGGHDAGPTSATEWFERLMRGSFPDPALGRTDTRLWMSSFVATYLERDVRMLRNVGDLADFDAFLRLVAARTGTTLDLTDLARTVGVAVNTAKTWMSVLVASYVVLLLPPYHANVGKRLAKRPKAYLTDVGLACYLTGLRDPEAAIAGPLGGALFETAVVSEVHRSLLHRGLPAELYYWGVSGRAEVDLLVRHDGKLVPLEVKLNATPVPRHGDAVRALLTTLPRDVITPGYVVTPGSSTLPLGENVKALPFARL
ncbi:MAG: GTP-binding protein [Coriobacteriaceae bacterium]|nr:GTP-binding protein [Coriobacteriaceae bacterium]